MEIANTELCDLAIKHKTDKFWKHRYTAVYHRLFADRRMDIKSLFEVGIAQGASLRMWEEFFPNADIFGFDRNPNSMINEGRIKSFFGNQVNAADLQKAGAEACDITADLLDVIIDDGDHDHLMQLSTAKTLLPFLKSDGTYIIEDIKCGDGWSDDPNNVAGQLSESGKFKAQVIRANKKKGDSVLVVLTRWNLNSEVK